MGMIQFAEKLSDILFLLILYSSIAIITPHLTLLTSDRLVVIFPTKIAILLACCIRIQSKQEFLGTLWPGI